MRKQFPVLFTSIAVVTLLLASFLPASALEIPKLTGRVNDFANMLSPSTQQQLEGLLAELEQADSTQIVILTLPSLEGTNLEELSLKIAENTHIGQERLDNGALLLISRNDRKLRIEVGYGLEGTLTDLACSRIIRNIITPRFKEGHFDQGVIDGVFAMAGLVRGEFQAADIGSSKNSLKNNAGGFFAAILFALFNIGMIFRSRTIAALAGAILLPIAGLLFVGASSPLIFALIPIGGGTGFLSALLLNVLCKGQGGGHGGGGPFFTSGRGPFYPTGGGFGGSFGGGGFSGGGGGFGGGGASGGW